MSKNVAVFVDVANLYYAAKSANVDVDYVTLLKGAVKGRDLIRAYAYSGLDPDNENQRRFIEFLAKNGYRVVHKDIRKYGDGKIKANLDIELVVDLFRLADRMDVAVIISGDGDFAPAIKALQDKGVRAEVVSFRGNTSSDLLAVADEFTDIMKIVQIGRTKKDAVVMGAPEMPAKEVVPEFGFRVASPSVAAAARAALRTGGTRGGRRPARQGEPPPVSAPAVGSEAEVRAEHGEVPFDDEELVPTAGEPPEGRARRRRRRGGRGRGGADRARVEPDEFEDRGELGDLGEEREYGFSEADPETLAELGLLDAVSASPGAASGDGAEAPTVDEVAPDDAAADVDAARRRTRRGRRGGRGRRRAEDQPEDSAPAAEPGDADGVATDGAVEAADEAVATGTEIVEPAALAAPQTEPATPAAAKRPRRARSRRGEDATPDAPAGEDAAATELAADSPDTPSPRPRRTRRSPARADAAAAGAREDAKTDGADAAADRPRRRRTSRTAATPPPEGGADGDRRGTESGEATTADGSAEGGPDQPRGIWQRLISTRPK